ncbi:hypothetical protein MN608_08392 [Microdochium nivale]|nr:hypothetical protein MN608_08392 [Microdochium nivale]
MAPSSAPFGQPPNTEDDYFVTKGLFRMNNIEGFDPAAGYVLALKPPPGYVFETRVTSFIAGNVIVALALFVPTAARLALRAKKDSILHFGWDDWAILLAMVVALGYPITQLVLLLMGTSGIHSWDLTYEEFAIGFHGAMIARSIFYVSVGLTKLSITLFIRRMAYRASRPWRIFINTFLVSVVAYVLLAIFWSLLACNPVGAQGDIALNGRAEPPPVCVDYVLQSRVLAGVHLAQGVALLTTPVVFLWKVRIDRAKKIRLFTTWAVGALAISSGLLRELRPPPLLDMSWEYTETFIWTSVDLTLELLVASLPVLDGMLLIGWHRATAHVAPGLGNSRLGSSGPRSQGRTTTTTNINTAKSPKHRLWPQAAAERSTAAEKSSRATAKLAVGNSRTESRESIVEKGAKVSDDGLEMTILRTHEIRVLYSPKQEHKSISSGSSGGSLDTAHREHYLDQPRWQQGDLGPLPPNPAVVQGASCVSSAVSRT